MDNISSSIQANDSTLNVRQAITLNNVYRIEWRMRHTLPNNLKDIILRITKCTCSISKNSSLNTEMRKFLLWMVHFGYETSAVWDLWDWIINLIDLSILIFTNKSNMINITQSSGVIARSNLWRYSMHHWHNSGRNQIKAMGSPLWWLWRKVTAL